MIVPKLYMNGTCNWIISCKVGIFYADVKTKMAVAAGFVLKLDPMVKRIIAYYLTLNLFFLYFRRSR